MLEVQHKTSFGLRIRAVLQLAALCCNICCCIATRCTVMQRAARCCNAMCSTRRSSTCASTCCYARRTPSGARPSHAMPCLCNACIASAPTAQCIHARSRDPARTGTCTHAHTHACARTHARTRTRTHAHARTHAHTVRDAGRSSSETAATCGGRVFRMTLPTRSSVSTLSTLRTAALHRRYSTPIRPLEYTCA
jgi:hypothetical protein